MMQATDLWNGDDSAAVGRFDLSLDLSLSFIPYALSTNDLRFDGNHSLATVSEP